MSASGPENCFIRSIHRAMQGQVPYIMKNHNAFNGGIADVWYSGRVADLWTEYKFLELPKRDSVVVDFRDVAKKYSLSALQQKWLRDRFKEGRNVSVIIGTPAGGIWLPADEWDCSFHAGDLRDLMKSKKDIADTILRYTMGSP